MVRDRNEKSKDTTAYLRLMLDAFSKIRVFTRGMSYNDFAADEKTQSAVSMQLQVVGELAKRVPEDMRKVIDVPWKQMAGLRDLVSHDYFGLDIAAIWRTAQTSAPEAEELIRYYLSSRIVSDNEPKS